MNYTECAFSAYVSPVVCVCVCAGQDFAKLDGFVFRSNEIRNEPGNSIVENRVGGDDDDDVVKDWLSSVSDENEIKTGGIRFITGVKFTRQLVHRRSAHDVSGDEQNARYRAVSGPTDRNTFPIRNPTAAAVVLKIMNFSSHISCGFRDERTNNVWQRSSRSGSYKNHRREKKKKKRRKIKVTATGGKRTKRNLVYREKIENRRERVCEEENRHTYENRT